MVHNLSFSDSHSDSTLASEFPSTFCSTDASFLQDSSVAGLGVMVIFNAGNQSWALHARSKVSATSPLHAEALSLLFAMHVLSSLQVHNCPCYGDNVTLIEWLNNNQEAPDWRSRQVVEDIKAMSYKINSSFHHISRSHNEIADALAKNAHCLNVSFEASCENCFHQHGCNIINNLCNMPPWVNCCISLPLMIFLPFWAFSLKKTPIYVSIIFLVKNNNIIFSIVFCFP